MDQGSKGKRRNLDPQPNELMNERNSVKVLERTGKTV
jgi:hypothetical protein